MLFLVLYVVDRPPAGDGKLYKGRPRGQPFASRCQAGDRIGCGVKFEAVAKNPGLQASMVPVFFTRNGKEVGTLNTCITEHCITSPQNTGCTTAPLHRSVLS